MKIRTPDVSRSPAIAGLLGLAVAVGCDHGGGSAPPARPGATGDAFLGPLAGASVSLTLVAPDGSDAAAPIATVQTNANGHFEFATVPATTFRVTASGGAYTDEATGARIDNTLSLSAIVPGGTQNIELSLLTTFAEQIARGQLSRLTGPTPANVDSEAAAANAVVDAAFGLTAHAYAIPPLFGPPDAAADPSGDRYRVAALAGACSQLATDYATRCAAPAQEVLAALIADIRDRVFDGKTLDPHDPQQLVHVQALCNGVPTNLPVGTGTVDLLAALDQFATTATGQAMQLAAHAGDLQPIRTGLASGPLAPPVVRVVPSQGLIAIDTAANVAYVPIYSQDATGNAQVAIVDLQASPPVVSGAPLALPGSFQPIASTLDPLTGRVYIAARRHGNGVSVYVVDTATRAILQTIDAVGVTHDGNFGGIIANPDKKKVIVVGTSSAGILSTATDPATFSSTSVVGNLGGTDSISLNLETELMFMASDGANFVLDTSTSPPTVASFVGGLGTTDGNAFDNLTDTLIVDPEFEDRTHVVNMAELDRTSFPASAPRTTVPGLGFTSIHGEGPGGQAVVNVLRHQGIVADEFGQNFRVMQLPTQAYTGAANNHGQPGTGTTPDTASAYSIAAAALPNLDVTGTGVPVPVAMRGDPNSLTVDPIRNMLYALVDDHTSYNSWPAGSSRPLFLVRVDLGNPVLGASPTAAVHWLPTVTYIRMP